MRLFFSEEKNQKTFIYLFNTLPHPPGQIPKVFCFFFQKRSLPSYPTTGANRYWLTPQTDPSSCPNNPATAKKNSRHRRRQIPASAPYAATSNSSTTSRFASKFASHCNAVR
jgi:hypothetical protein